MSVGRWLAAFALLVLGAGLAAAQTRYNPDISVIGDIRGKTADRPEHLGLEQRWNYSLEEVELAAQGYLNPYARADVFLSYEGGAADVEEAYVTFERGLPWGLSARAGRYLLDFGRLNLLHPHAWSFIEQPLAHRDFFGEGGLADDGVSMRWLLPLQAVYAQVSVDVLKGSAFLGGSPVPLDDSPPDAGVLARASLAGATGQFAETAGGVSFAYGHYDPAGNLSTTLMGMDIKHKVKPSRYTSLTVMAEAIIDRLEKPGAVPAETTTFENHFGAYAFLDYQFRQRYNVGAKVDYVEPIENRENRTMQYQAFVGFAPVEETTLLRFSGFYRKPSHSDGVFGAIAQLVFSLGPHHPHYF